MIKSLTATVFGLSLLASSAVLAAEKTVTLTVQRPVCQVGIRAETPDVGLDEYHMRLSLATRDGIAAPREKCTSGMYQSVQPLSRKILKTLFNFGWLGD